MSRNELISNISSYLNNHQSFIRIVMGYVDTYSASQVAKMTKQKDIACEQRDHAIRMMADLREDYKRLSDLGKEYLGQCEALLEVCTDPEEKEAMEYTIERIKQILK